MKGSSSGEGGFLAKNTLFYVICQHFCHTRPSFASQIVSHTRFVWRLISIVILQMIYKILWTKMVLTSNTRKLSCLLGSIFSSILWRNDRMNGLTRRPVRGSTMTLINWYIIHSMNIFLVNVQFYTWELFKRVGHTFKVRFKNLLRCSVMIHCKAFSRKRRKAGLLLECFSSDISKMWARRENDVCKKDDPKSYLYFYRFSPRPCQVNLNLAGSTQGHMFLNILFDILNFSFTC